MIAKGALSLLIAAALLCGPVLILFWLYYVPADHWGSETVNFFVLSQNLAAGHSASIAFLTDDTPHDLSGAAEVVYTHSPNGHRLIGATLWFLGARTIFPMLLAACLLGALLTAWLLNKISRGDLLLVVFIAGFFAIDFYSLLPLANAFRVWHFPLLLACFYATAYGSRFALAAAFVALGLYEIAFAAFVFFSCVVTTSLLHPRQVALRRTKCMMVGAAIAAGLFLIQLIAYFGPSGLVAEAIKTYQSRAGVASYCADAAWFSNRFSFSELVSDYYGNRVLTDFTKVVPCNLIELGQSVAASVTAAYGPILASVVGLAILAFPFALRRELSKPSRLFCAGALAMTAALLATWLVFRSYVAFIYVMIQYPMLNFIVAFALAAIVLLMRHRNTGSAVAVAVILLVAIIPASYKNYQSYPLLNSWPVYQNQQAALRSNLPQPWSWIVFGTTGVLVPATPASPPDLCIPWKWLPPC